VAKIEFTVGDTLLSPDVPATIGPLVATPVSPERVVPVRRACGRYVDWYRPARG
jgi:hypothetical protein